MINDNVLLEKSLKFATRIVKLYQYLVKEKKESIISKQLIRSGTSIGANANEAVYGVSQADFIAKLQISLKETAETEYWLRLLVMSGYIDETQGNSMINDCLEIKRILIASLKTAKDKNQWLDEFESNRVDKNIFFSPFRNAPLANAWGAQENAPLANAWGAQIIKNKE